MGYFIGADTWDEALDMALLAAKANDTILFSPGCRAQEPFLNFKERGAYFNRLVEIKRQTKNNLP
jgi:UDP-N-acetylmuramoylalanine-D-glutamate ligase